MVSCDKGGWYLCIMDLDTDVGLVYELLLFMYRSLNTGVLLGKKGVAISVSCV